MHPFPADVRLLSTDFDGTIHEDFVRPGIPAALQRKLTELQRIGVVWVINTGRDMASLMESLYQADIWVRPDYVVLVEREIFRRDGGDYVPVEPWNSKCAREHAQLFALLEVELGQLREQLTRDHQAQFYQDTYSPICAVAEDNAQMDQIEAAVRQLIRDFTPKQRATRPNQSAAPRRIPGHPNRWTRHSGRICRARGLNPNPRIQVGGSRSS